MRNITKGLLVVFLVACGNGPTEPPPFGEELSTSERQRVAETLEAVANTAWSLFHGREYEEGARYTLTCSNGDLVDVNAHRFEWLDDSETAHRLGLHAVYEHCQAGTVLTTGDKLYLGGHTDIDLVWFSGNSFTIDFAGTLYIQVGDKEGSCVVDLARTRQEMRGRLCGVDYLRTYN